MNAFKRSLSLQMLRSLAQHDFCAFFQRKSGDARAHGGERDGLQPALVRDLQAMRGGISQGLRSRFSAEPHARGVDHEPRLQFSSGSDRRVPYRNAANFVALALNGVATFSADGARHASAQNQIVVRGVDDGVRIHFRQVALLDNYLVREWFHCQCFLPCCFPLCVFIHFAALRLQPQLLCPCGALLLGTWQRFPPKCTAYGPARFSSSSALDQKSACRYIARGKRRCPQNPKWKAK